MSLGAINWARTAPGPPTSKFVLLALADEADDAGICVAADQRVAEKCGMTIDAFLRTVKLLESVGRLAIANTTRYFLAMT